MSLLALRQDIAHARTKKIIKKLQESHECTCDDTGVRKCTCRFQWSHIYREIYEEQIIMLRGSSNQFSPAPEYVMLQRRIVERNTILGIECSICYDPLAVGKFCTKVVACEHRFHVACAKRWFRDTDANTSCPLCRHQVIC
jgi:hypothetical protein